MSKLFSVLLFAFLFGIKTFAQNTERLYKLDDLSLQWEIVENNYKGGTQFLSAFTLTNNGAAFPATGWKFYFNFPRMIQPASVTGGVSIQHINGDFYSLSPTQNFKGLAPKASARIEFVSGAWAINITDAPAGLYLVWDDAPNKGLPLTHYTVKPATQPKQYMRTPADKLKPSTPQSVYLENKDVVDIPAVQLIKVFPTPVIYKESAGSFVLMPGYRIVTKPDDDLEAEKNYLAAELKKLLAGEKRPEGKELRLLKTSSQSDAYKLSVTPRFINISSGTNRGIFYGIQSLKTLIPPQAFKGRRSSINIPAVEVVDSPRFGHRAFLLDVGRNFQTKDEVLKVLDLMALYKLNVFHLHLTDDEGWRLEIPGLPELTTVGVRKGHAVNDDTFLHPSYGSGPTGTVAGSGFYTRKDFVEILKYAKQRYIDVIPEIESPGHARAAIAAMTARYRRLISEGKQKEAEEYLLYHPADTSAYQSVQRWTRNVMDPALPSTYSFLEKITDEIRAMYNEAGAPLKLVHFGGDEVPAGVWKGSPAVQALMKQESNLQTVDDLWYYFYSKLKAMLKGKGLSLYGWEEMALRKTMQNGKAATIPNPDFANDNVHVDVWNNVIGWGAEDLAYRLANAGYKVVLSPVSNLYFDMAYQKSFYEPGYYWGSFVDVDKPFYLIPLNYYKNTKEDNNGIKIAQAYFKNSERLTEKGEQNIPGIQGLLWSETLTTAEEMEYKLLPKLLALAERAWAQSPAWAEEKDSIKAATLYKQDWSRFANVIGKRELFRLDYYAGSFTYRIPTAGAIVKNGILMANGQLPGATIRYTTDGSEPTLTSTRYTLPVRVKGVVKLKLFVPGGRSGRTVSLSAQD